MPTQQEIDDAKDLAYYRSLLDPRVLASNSKFVPKLTFDERCAVYGLARLGVEHRQLAAAFGINRSTVNYIIKPSSPHYKNVRREFFELGEGQFLKKYVTPDVRLRLLSYADDEEVRITDAQLKAKHLKEMPVPKAQADSAEGVFSYTEAFYGPDKVFTARVVFGVPDGPSQWDVKAVPDVRTQGWYVKHPDEVDLVGNVEDNKTSASAKKAFLAAIGGEEV